MSCAPFDLKDYFLGELRVADREAVERHLEMCAACRDEVNALGMTRSALLSLSDEEPPRRIAFVSDQVFESSWWQKLWRSGPQLGFASAAMLSAALLVHAFVPRTAPMAAPAPVAQTVPIEKAVNVDAEVQKRLETAVAHAVSASQSQQSAQVLELVNQRLRQAESRHREDLLLVREYLERMDKRNAMVRRTVYDMGAIQQ
jgi:anti-sigma factor RsiW